ncbi:MAG TPA: chemotaxis protein CheW [Patescibacteria group bacterium]|nr:chemotaxis protein CheW [Patescibacteria group bacterium]
MSTKEESALYWPGKGIQLVTFRLGSENYAVPVWRVKEIIRPIDTFPIPGMSGPVEGVINLRGEIIPVIRIHEVLGVRSTDDAAEGRKRRIIILDAVGGGFGFGVDEVMEVARISSEDVRPAPETGCDKRCGVAVLGIVRISGRIVVCIDPSKLVQSIVNVQDLAVESV